MIVDTCYEAFLASHYGAAPGLANTSYEHQHRALLDRSFGTTDAYSRNLRELGHEAMELISNCRPMQVKWAEEHSLALPISSKLAPARLSWGTLRRILDAQIEELDPDVVYVQNVMDVERLRPRALEGRGRYLVALGVSRRRSRSSISTARRRTDGPARLWWDWRPCRRTPFGSSSPNLRHSADLPFP